MHVQEIPPQGEHPIGASDTAVEAETQHAVAPPENTESDQERTEILEAIASDPSRVCEAICQKAHQTGVNYLREIQKKAALNQNPKDDPEEGQDKNEKIDELRNPDYIHERQHQTVTSSYSDGKQTSVRMIMSAPTLVRGVKQPLLIEPEVRGQTTGPYEAFQQTQSHNPMYDRSKTTRITSKRRGRKRKLPLHIEEDWENCRANGPENVVNAFVNVMKQRKEAQMSTSIRNDQQEIAKLGHEIPKNIHPYQPKNGPSNTMRNGFPNGHEPRNQNNSNNNDIQASTGHHEVHQGQPTQAQGHLTQALGQSAQGQFQFAQTQPTQLRYQHGQHFDYHTRQSIQQPLGYEQYYKEKQLYERMHGKNLHAPSINNSFVQYNPPPHWGMTGNCRLPPERSPSGSHIQYINDQNITQKEYNRRHNEQAQPRVQSVPNSFPVDSSHNRKPYRNDDQYHRGKFLPPHWWMNSFDGQNGVFRYDVPIDASRIATEKWNNGQFEQHIGNVTRQYIRDSNQKPKGPRCKENENQPMPHYNVNHFPTKKDRQDREQMVALRYPQNSFRNAQMDVANQHPEIYVNGHNSGTKNLMKYENGPPPLYQVIPLKKQRQWQMHEVRFPPAMHQDQQYINEQQWIKRGRSQDQTKAVKGTKKRGRPRKNPSDRKSKKPINQPSETTTEKVFPKRTILNYLPLDLSTNKKPQHGSEICVTDDASNNKVNTKAERVVYDPNGDLLNIAHDSNIDIKDCIDRATLNKTPSKSSSSSKSVNSFQDAFLQFQQNYNVKESEEATEMSWHTPSNYDTRLLSKLEHPNGSQNVQTLNGSDQGSKTVLPSSDNLRSRRSPKFEIQIIDGQETIVCYIDEEDFLNAQNTELMTNLSTINSPEVVKRLLAKPIETQQELLAATSKSVPYNSQVATQEGYNKYMQSYPNPNHFLQHPSYPTFAYMSQPMHHSNDTNQSIPHQDANNNTNPHEQMISPKASGTIAHTHSTLHSHTAPDISTITNSSPNVPADAIVSISCKLCDARYDNIDSMEKHFIYFHKIELTDDSIDINFENTRTKSEKTVNVATPVLNEEVVDDTSKPHDTRETDEQDVTTGVTIPVLNEDVVNDSSIPQDFRNTDEPDVRTGLTIPVLNEDVVNDSSNPQDFRKTVEPDVTIGVQDNDTRINASCDSPKDESQIAAETLISLQRRSSAEDEEWQLQIDDIDAANVLIDMKHNTPQLSPVKHVASSTVSVDGVIDEIKGVKEQSECKYVGYETSLSPCSHLEKVCGQNNGPSINEASTCDSATDATKGDLLKLNETKLNDRNIDNSDRDCTKEPYITFVVKKARQKPTRRKKVQAEKTSFPNTSRKQNGDLKSGKLIPDQKVSKRSTPNVQTVKRLNDKEMIPSAYKTKSIGRVKNMTTNDSILLKPNKKYGKKSFFRISLKKQNKRINSKKKVTVKKSVQKPVGKHLDRRIRNLTNDLSDKNGTALKTTSIPSAKIRQTGVVDSDNENSEVNDTRETVVCNTGNDVNVKMDFSPVANYSVATDKIQNEDRDSVEKRCQGENNTDFTPAILKEMVQETTEQSSGKKFKPELEEIFLDIDDDELPDIPNDEIEHQNVEEKEKTTGESKYLGDLQTEQNIMKRSMVKIDPVFENEEDAHPPHFTIMPGEDSGDELNTFGKIIDDDDERLRIKVISTFSLAENDGVVPTEFVPDQNPNNEQDKDSTSKRKIPVDSSRSELIGTEDTDKDDDVKDASKKEAPNIVSTTVTHKRDQQTNEVEIPGQTNEVEIPGETINTPNFIFDATDAKANEVTDKENAGGDKHEDSVATVKAGIAKLLDMEKTHNVEVGGQERKDYSSKQDGQVSSSNDDQSLSSRPNVFDILSITKNDNIKVSGSRTLRVNSAPAQSEDVVQTRSVETSKDNNLDSFFEKAKKFGQLLKKESPIKHKPICERQFSGSYPRYEIISKDVSKRQATIDTVGAVKLKRNARKSTRSNFWQNNLNTLPHDSYKHEGDKTPVSNSESAFRCKGQNHIEIKANEPQNSGTSNPVKVKKAKVLLRKNARKSGVSAAELNLAMVSLDTKRRPKQPADQDIYQRVKPKRETSKQLSLAERKRLNNSTLPEPEQNNKADNLNKINTPDKPNRTNKSRMSTDTKHEELCVSSENNGLEKENKTDDISDQLQQLIGIVTKRTDKLKAKQQDEILGNKPKISNEEKRPSRTSKRKPEKENINHEKSIAKDTNSENIINKESTSITQQTVNGFNHLKQVFFKTVETKKMDKVEQTNRFDETKSKSSNLQTTEGFIHFKQALTRSEEKIKPEKPMYDSGTSEDEGNIFEIPNETPLPKFLEKTSSENDNHKHVGREGTLIKNHGSFKTLTQPRKMSDDENSSDDDKEKIKCQNLLMKLKNLRTIAQKTYEKQIVGKYCDLSDDESEDDMTRVKKNELVHPKTTEVSDSDDELPDILKEMTSRHNTSRSGKGKQARIVLRDISPESSSEKHISVKDNSLKKKDTPNIQDILPEDSSEKHISVKDNLLKKKDTPNIQDILPEGSSEKHISVKNNSLKKKDSPSTVVRDSRSRWSQIRTRRSTRRRRKRCPSERYNDDHYSFDPRNRPCKVVLKDISKDVKYKDATEFRTIKLSKCYGLPKYGLSDQDESDHQEQIGKQSKLKNKTNYKTNIDDTQISTYFNCKAHNSESMNNESCTKESNNHVPFNIKNIQDNDKTGADDTVENSKADEADNVETDKNQGNNTGIETKSKEIGERHNKQRNKNEPYMPQGISIDKNEINNGSKQSAENEGTDAKDNDNKRHEDNKETDIKHNNFGGKGMDADKLNKNKEALDNKQNYKGFKAANSRNQSNVEVDEDDKVSAKDPNDQIIEEHVTEDDEEDLQSDDDEESDASESTIPFDIVSFSSSFEE